VKSKDMQNQGDTLGVISRRSLLRGTAVLAASGPVVAQREREGGNAGPRSGAIYAYVGTYTPNGKGIYLFSLNPATGVLTLIRIFESTVSPSWIAFDANKTHLYVANEISSFNGMPTGSVSAYAVDRTSGNLSLLNTVTSGGAGPAHLSVDPKGEYVFVANYGGGNVAVLPIMENGLLGNPTDVVADTSACSPPCPVGPTRAEKAPPGSFAISGHDAPHAHMIQADPAGNYVLAQDLGLDLTIVWKFDRENGKLINHQTVPSSPGAGPRHFAFHPNGRWLYSLNEEASTLTFMTYNTEQGRLTVQEEVTTLPEGFKGTNFTSEVIVSMDGRFVYCLNRLHNTIAIFLVDATGRPDLIGEVWTRADYPRNCAIDPTGNFMYVCHNRSDNVTTFRVHRATGRLTFTGEYVAVGSPAVIDFLWT
jgi:6-phosphogluconolactonase